MSLRPARLTGSQARLQYDPTEGSSVNPALAPLLTPGEIQILELVAKCEASLGACSLTIKEIADVTGLSRQWVMERLWVLCGRGYLVESWQPRPGTYGGNWRTFRLGEAARAAEGMQ